MNMLPRSPQSWEKEYTQKLDAKTKYENPLTLAAANLMSNESLQKLARYHGSIEREFYRAFHELERLQRMRMGLPVPIPFVVDINGQNQANGNE